MMGVRMRYTALCLAALWACVQAVKDDLEWIKPVEVHDLNLDVSAFTNGQSQTPVPDDYSLDSIDWHKYDFAVYIDGGSTGSRVHIYQWPKRIFNAVPPTWSVPFTHEGWQKKITPGIASFAEEPEKAGDSLKPLVDFALDILKPTGDRVLKFPIFFKATGGLREVDPEQQLKIITSIRNFMEDNIRCPFDFRNSQARVLSGEEEGAFAWTTVNYLMGTFLPYMSGFGSVAPAVSYGSLDLGGSSTQIGFFRKEEDIVSNLYKLQVGSQKHWNIYTHSFLHFGRNSFGVRYREMILEVYANESTIHEPCVQKNHETKWGNKSIIGTGKFDECLQRMEPLFHKNENVWCMYSHHGRCSMVGVYQPPLEGHFIAFSGYAKIYKWLGLPSDASLTMLGQRTDHACNMTMEGLKKYLPHVKRDSDRENVCFFSAYAYNLLSFVYGFPSDDTPITVVDNIGGKEIDWVTGSVLYEVNGLPWKLKEDYKAPPPAIDTELEGTDESESWSIGSMLLLSMFTTLGGVFVGVHFARRNRWPYNPINDRI